MKYKSLPNPLNMDLEGFFPFGTINLRTVDKLVHKDLSSKLQPLALRGHKLLCCGS